MFIVAVAFLSIVVVVVVVVVVTVVVVLVLVFVALIKIANIYLVCHTAKKNYNSSTVDLVLIVGQAKGKLGLMSGSTNNSWCVVNATEAN